MYRNRVPPIEEGNGAGFGIELLQEWLGWFALEWSSLFIPFQLMNYALSGVLDLQIQM